MLRTLFWGIFEFATKEKGALHLSGTIKLRSSNLFVVNHTTTFCEVRGTDSTFPANSNLGKKYDNQLIKLHDGATMKSLRQ